MATKTSPKLTSAQQEILDILRRLYPKPRKSSHPQRNIQVDRLLNAHFDNILSMDEALDILELVTSNPTVPLGLTKEQFASLGQAAHAVYEHIGHDIGLAPRRSGLWKRNELLTILFDCHRVHNELMGKGMGYQNKPYPDADIIARAIADTDPPKLFRAMKAHFEAEWWEGGMN